MLSEPRSSEGFGGVGPAGRTLKFSMGRRRMASSGAALFITRLERPIFSAGEPSEKILWKLGRLKSVSIRITCLPISAIVVAIFTDVKVFPSRG